MSASPRHAVFLSYASQNAVEAARIGEALRAAGVEVWFDRDELRGGDAWDSKIRGRIAACALFVPVISAATQARLEGYFRLEWKLAARRTHSMASTKAFLLPVVIDETGDAEAHVPDEFREVQWTRVPGGAAGKEFCERVRALLDGPETPAVRPRAAAPREEAGSPRPVGRGGRGWRAGLIAAAVVAGGAALYFAGRPRADAGAGSSARTTAAPAAPLTRGQNAVAQARSLYEPWDFASSDDFKLADRLLKEATDLEPLNADAWAELAIQSYGQHALGFDRNDARAELLRLAADRAVKLLPGGDRSKLALALHYRLSPGNDAEALRVLEELAGRVPADKFVLRQLGSVLSALGRSDESLRAYDRAIALPGGDPIAHTGRALRLMAMGRIDEAQDAIDRALAARPDYWFACVLKPSLLLQYRGQIEPTKRALERVPARVMADERVGAVAAYYWFTVREADKASEALRHVTRDYVESNVVQMPKALLAGLVHKLAGRSAAATTEWRVALGVVEQRLATNRTATGSLGDKALLQALLGDRAAAQETLRTLEELRRWPAGRANGVTWTIYAALDRETELADYFAERLAAKPAEFSLYHAALLRVHPALDAFRPRPRFQALMAEGERLIAASASASPRGEPKK